MTKKIRVAILFGGKSAEHEVSLQSAKSIIEAIDKEKYELVLIGIDKTGRWLLNNQSHYLLHSDNPKLIALNKSSSTKNVILNVSEGSDSFFKTTHDSSISSENDNELVAEGKIDVVFPVLHGTLGEDGAMQGLLKIMDVAYVGADVLGSALGMDKDVMKRLLRDAGIQVAKFVVAKRGDKVSFGEVTQKVGLPFFVKPANEGSSVGVAKVRTESEFAPAVKEAFAYDNKILIEEFIEAREIECSVLGNEDPIASVPGEIIPHHEFYSYEAKYIDEKGAGLVIPAKLSKELSDRVREVAVQAFKTLCCEGMARVDCFLTKDHRIYVNEINTIPGFTKISMYPKLWEASGLSYKALIDRLIELAIQRHERDKQLKTSFT